MECPRCRLINPETAERCDCGYEFASGLVKESYLVSEAQARHPDLAQWLRESARRDIKTGIVAIAAGLGVTVFTYALRNKSPEASGGGPASFLVFVGPVVYGLFLIGRAVEKLRAARGGARWKKPGQ